MFAHYNQRPKVKGGNLTLFFDSAYTTFGLYVGPEVFDWVESDDQVAALDVKPLFYHSGGHQAVHGTHPELKEGRSGH